MENGQSKERDKMRKSKHSIELEESPPGSSKDFGAELDDLDEEIIDLEEVIEPLSDEIEGDEPAFDAEILDAEPSLDLKDLGGKTDSEEDFLLEDDLMKELPFFQDEKAKPEVTQTAESVGEKSDDFDLDLFLDKTKAAHEEAEAMTRGEAEPQVSTPSIEAPLEAAAAPAAESAAALAASLDDFIVQIESKLIDAARDIVESRLPEIVRTVLREEIEKLKADLEPDK